MDRTKHAQILCAYLNRLPLAAIEEIFKKQKAAWHASMNLGLSSQIKEQEEFAQAVQTAMDRIIDSDKRAIEDVIQKAI